MGCVSSKGENEELVARCRARKHFLKQAVYRRHAFAACHAQYVVALKGAGSAFRQFAEGEVKDPALSAALFLPETRTSPPGFELASRLPMPLLPPPPPPPMSPPMSPTISPTFPPALPPPSHPRLELPRLSPLHQKRASLKQDSPPPRASKKPNSNAVRNGILGANFNIPIQANSSPRAMTMELDKSLNSPPPRLPPFLLPVSFEEDWSYLTPRALPPPPPPPPLSPPREGMPPLPPPTQSSRWQQILLDPSRPLPFPSSFPHYCEQQDHEQRQGLQPPRVQLQHLNLKQVGEEDIPELEEVDDNDDTIDGPPLQDLDDEELEQEELKFQEAKFPIVKSQPQMKNIQQWQQEVDSDVVQSEPAELKPKPIMKVNEEFKTSKEMIISVVKEHGAVLEKVTVEAQKQLTSWTLHNPEKQAAGHDLLEVLKEVDDCFLHAAESGNKVSQMLETKKIHYHHSSFSDSFKGVGESARMFNVSFQRLSLKSADRLPSPHQHIRNGNHKFTFSSEESARISSTKSLSSLSGGEGTDDGNGSTASHASTLDTLYAWEKKLYLEVKEAETLRNEFERKCAVYRNQDARGEGQLAIDKTRANIRMLQTRLAVAVEAVETAATAVQKLRDDELYPQLLQLLEEMMNMWKEISNCHHLQMKAVEAMKRLDKSTAAAAFQEATTSFHHESTAQLEAALIKWVESLSKLVLSQREYVKSLTSWLWLSLPYFVEPERKESQFSPKLHSLVQNNLNTSPVHALCQQWQTSIDQMPDRVAIEAIAGFAAVVREMLRLQYEELRIRKKAKFFAHELEKQQRSLHTSTSMREMMSISVHPPPLQRSPTSNSVDSSDIYGQNLDVISSHSSSSRSRRTGGCTTKVFTERLQQTETVRRRLEEELEAERKAHIHTRAYTLNSLQTGLPFMFQALVTFSKIESDIYERLYRMGHRRHLDNI